MNRDSISGQRCTVHAVDERRIEGRTAAVFMGLMQKGMLSRHRWHPARRSQLISGKAAVVNKSECRSCCTRCRVAGMREHNRTGVKSGATRAPEGREKKRSGAAGKARQAGTRPPLFPVGLISIIRKRITHSLHAPSTSSVSLHSPHSPNSRYPLTRVTHLTHATR